MYFQPIPTVNDADLVILQLGGWRGMGLVMHLLQLLTERQAFSALALTIDATCPPKQSMKLGASGSA